MSINVPFHINKIVRNLQNPQLKHQNMWCDQAESVVWRQYWFWDIGHHRMTGDTISYTSSRNSKLMTNCGYFFWHLFCWFTKAVFEVTLHKIKHVRLLQLFCFVFSGVICDVIKQNESEVDTDMLLVSDCFYTSDIWEYNLRPDICEPLQY